MKKLIYLDGKKYDISGPSGNAFAILGTVQRYLKQCGVPAEDINEFLDEAKSGDYDNLLRVANEATGIEFVDRKDFDEEWLN